MKQRLFSTLLAFAVILGIIPSVASAASTPEEALGEVNIYSGGYSMKYLAVMVGCKHNPTLISFVKVVLGN